MKKFDLAIVGGGVLGAFHAYHALLKGLSVVLFEKDTYPQGSTIQNFGQVVPSGLAGKWFEYGRESLAIYEKIQAKANISLRKNGSIYIASSTEEMAVLEELAQKYTAVSYENQLWTAEQVLEKYPDVRRDYVRGALYFPQEISVEPHQMIASLLVYLEQKEGLVYASRTPIVALQEGSEGVKLTSSQGTTWTAERALICGGYESQWLFPEIIKNSGLIISKLQMLQTVPLPSVVLPGNVLTGLTIQRYESFQTCDAHAHLPVLEREMELKKWGVHVLFKQAMDGSIILGDSHEYAPIFEKETLGLGTKEEIDRLILDEAARILSVPLKDKIARKWAGMYSQHEVDIFDKMVTPSVRILTGIGGKGMTSSAGFAHHSLENWS